MAGPGIALHRVIVILQPACDLDPVTHAEAAFEEFAKFAWGLPEDERVVAVIFGEALLSFRRDRGNVNHESDETRVGSVGARMVAQHPAVVVLLVLAAVGSGHECLQIVE